MRNLFPLALLFSVLPAAAADDLSCLTDAEQKTAALYPRLQDRAFALLSERRPEIDKLETADQIRTYQQKMRQFLVTQLGGFPERSPLNARTVRTIKADGYRIELVIFDSVPGHRITANLYLPESGTAVPGVAVSSGHSRTAKTADYNQRFGIAMVRQGLAALCFDPIGQGERSQILDKSGQPRFSGTTTEHFLVGFGSTLVGRNTARYRVWDAMRAIDYMQSRPEIDGSRIGFTGCSGGGTITSYVMALDDRITCAAPACYLTTFAHLIRTIGPQDAEQNIFGQVKFGLDHPDYVLMRAPRPTLISSTTGDYFSIEGAWENYRQAKQIYGRLGFPERVDLVEVAGKHGVKPQNLATIRHWMTRWLQDRDQNVAPVTLTTRPAKELLCTDSGQVLHAANELSVFDLNARAAERLASERQKLHADLSPAQLRKRIWSHLRLPDNDLLIRPEWEDRGRLKREHDQIDRLILKSGTGAVIPGLTFHPPSPTDDAYLYLHDQGKTGDSETDGPIEKLVDDGHAVVTCDLSGQGELANGPVDDLLTDWKTYFLAYLLGDSLTGLRTADALVAADFVAFYEKERDNPRKVHLVGVGRSGIVALHAAALRPELFASVTLKGVPRSWADLVEEPVPTGQLDAIVHGALKLYDLPDLIQLAGIEKIRIED